jgi:gliding motility-associated-like protein
LCIPGAGFILHLYSGLKKKAMRTLFVFTTAILIAAAAQAQSPCIAAEMQHRLHEEQPELLHEQEQLDVFARDYANTAARGPQNVFTLPVVVHIIHQNGAENITDAQVFKALEYLNQAFAHTGPYAAAGAGTNTNIQFCLAQRTPEQENTNGITRTASPFTDMIAEADNLDLKNLSRWDPTQYINIWVVRSIYSYSLGPQVVGYAYLASAHGSATDGLVIEADWFGTTPDQSKALIHEMGHYLNLYHTFEGGCQNDLCDLQGDRVCDTAPDQAQSGGCVFNSCTTDADDTRPLNPFGSDGNDPTQNYMDYSPPTCQLSFSPGQALRMRAAVEGRRKSLLESLACLPPCTQPLSADFSVPQEVLTGETAVFQYTGTGATIFEWRINGVTESNQANLSYVFPETGQYEIILRVRNNAPGCLATSTQKILVRCNIRLAISPGDTLIAPGSSLTLEANASGAAALSWSVNGMAAGSGNLLSYTFSAAGTAQVRLSASNDWCSATAFAQVRTGDVCEDSVTQWRYSGAVFSCLYKLPDGGHLMLGDGRVMRVGPDGQVIWANYRTQNASFENMTAAALPNGNIVLAYDVINSGSIIAVELLAPDGSLIWAKSYRGRRVLELLASPNNSFLVMTEVVMIKLDENGEMLWFRGYSLLHGITKRSNGTYNLLVQPSSVSDQVYLIHLSADGNVLKAVLIEGFLLTNLVQKKLFALPEDQVLLWYSNDKLFALDSAFNPIWQREFITSTLNINIQTNESGDILLYSNQTNDDDLLYCLDKNGAYVWGAVLDISASNSYISSNIAGKGWALIQTDNADSSVILLQFPTRWRPSGCGLLRTISVFSETVTQQPAPVSFAFGNYVYYQFSNYTATLQPMGNTLVSNYCKMQVFCAPPCNVTMDEQYYYSGPQSMQHRIINNGIDQIMMLSEKTGQNLKTISFIDRHGEETFTAELLADTVFMFRENNLILYRYNGKFYISQHSTFSNYTYEIVNAPVNTDPFKAIFVNISNHVICFGERCSVTYLDPFDPFVTSSTSSGFLLSDGLKVDELAFRSTTPNLYYYMLTSNQNEYRILNMENDNIYRELQLLVDPDSWKHHSFFNYGSVVFGLMQHADNGILYDYFYSIDNVFETVTSWRTPSFSTENKIFAYGNRLLYSHKDSGGQYFATLLNQDGTPYGTYRLDLPANTRVSSAAGSNYEWILAASTPDGKMYNLRLPFVKDSNSCYLLGSPLIQTEAATIPYTTNLITSLLPAPDLDLSLVNVSIVEREKLKREIACEKKTPCLEICDNSLDDDSDGLADCFDPDCNCLPCTLPDASAQIDSIWCANGHTKVQVRICNTGQSLLRSDWPLQFSDGNGQMLSTSLTTNLEITPNNCVLQEYTLDNPPTALLRVQLNPAAAAPFEECDYSNNSAERAFAPPPSGVPDLGPDQTLCSANTLTLQAPGGFVAYQWQDGSTESSYTAPGPGLYWLNAQDICGAWHSDTIRLLLTPAGEIELGSDRRICRGDTLHFQVSGFEQLRWWPEAGLSCTDCPAPVFKPDSSGTLYVTALKGECLAADSLRVEVQEYAFASVADQALDCFIPSVELLAEVSQPNAILRWYDPQGQLLTGIPPEVNTPGLYRLELSDSSGLCRTDALLRVVDTRVLPLLDLPSEQRICRGDSLQLAVSPQPDVRYTWNTGAEGPTLWARDAGFYKVAAAFATCISTDSVRVVVEPCLGNIYLPNAFAPEGSGNNAVYLPGISPLMEVLEYRMEIYDRWGELLFRTQNPAEGWDGRARGRTALPGVYVVLVIAKVQDRDQILELRKSGDVLLMR